MAGRTRPRLDTGVADGYQPPQGLYRHGLSRQNSVGRLLQLWPERLDLKVPDDIVSTGDPDTLRLLSQRRAPENVPDVELPYSSIDGYACRLDDCPCYIAGQHESRALVLLADAGMTADLRMQKLCVGLAAEGFYVVMPDIRHGDSFDLDKRMRMISRYLLGKGSPCACCLAVGWGAWAWMRAMHDGTLPTNCGAMIDPDIDEVQRALGETRDATALANGARLKVPTLVLTPGAHPDASAKPNGAFVEALKANAPASAAHCYVDMERGFFTRGDASKFEVERDVKDAVRRVAAFFKRYCLTSRGEAGHPRLAADESEHIWLSLPGAQPDDDGSPFL